MPGIPVGLALTLHWGIILTRRFDGLYGQDAFAYYDYALQVWESVPHLRLPPPFHWPIGYPAMMAASFALTGFSPLAGQLVSSLAGAGVVLLTYLLARDLLSQQGVSAAVGRWVGMVAGLLAAASGQLWQWSITVMADTPALFWATLAGWSLVRYGTSLRLRWLLLTAFGLAWAVMTRSLFGLLMFPFGAYWLFVLATRPTTRDQRPMSVVHRSSFVAHLLLAGLAGLIMLSPQIALTASFPAPVLEHQWLVSWSPLNALRSEFMTVDGYATYPLPVALFYAKAAASPRYLFPLLTPFLIVGLAVIISRRWWLTAVLLIGWGAVTYSFLVGIPYQNFRFTLTFLPAEVIVTAIGLRLVWEWLRPRWRPLLLAYLMVGVAGGVAYSSRVVNAFVYRKVTDLAVTRWVESQMMPDSQVLSFGLTLTLRHYTALDVPELFLLSTDDLQVLLAADRPTYLLVDVGNLQRQWLGHSPERNYRALQEDPGLVELGRKHGYTLFRVQRGGLSSREVVP